MDSIQSGLKVFIQELSDLVPAQQYQKREIISKPGISGVVYVVKNGRVEIFEDNNRQKFIHEILRKNDIFGDFGLSKDHRTYARAIENTTIIAISNRQFVHYMMSNSQYLWAVFEYVYRKFQRSQEKMMSLALDPVSVRLIKILIELAERVTTNENKQVFVVDHYTHVQLAQMIGSSRQTVTTALNRLVKEELITPKGKQYFFDTEILKTTIKYQSQT